MTNRLRMWLAILATGMMVVPTLAIAGAEEGNNGAGMSSRGNGRQTGISLSADRASYLPGDEVRLDANMNEAKWVWEQKGPAPFPAINGGGMVWASNINRMIVFGGAIDAPPYSLNDTWSYDPINDAWSQKEPGPSPRSFFACAWDPINNKMIVFGGDRSGGPVSDTWAYDPVTNVWAQKRDGPWAGCRMATAWDDISNEMLIYGGEKIGGILLKELWSYNLTTDIWTRKNDGPFIAEFGTFVAAPHSNCGILFGGRVAVSGDDAAPYVAVYDYRNGIWTRKEDAPIERSGHVAVWNDMMNRMLIFGGRPEMNAAQDELWSYDLSDDSWVQIEKGTTWPERRINPFYCWNPIDKELIMTCGGTKNSNFNDTWLYHSISGPQRMTFEIYYPSGPLYITLTNTTGFNGSASVSFMLPANAPAGTYACQVSAKASGQTFSASASFVVTEPIPTEPAPARFVHITDTHIGAKGSGAEQRLSTIVTRILGFSPKPDYVLVTGDIVDFGHGTGGTANYHCFLEIIKPLEDAKIKVLTVPGNHDYREKSDLLGSAPYLFGLGDLSDTRLQEYREAMGARDLCNKNVSDANYIVIGLDGGHDTLIGLSIDVDIDKVALDPRTSGLTDGQIAWLEKTLDDLDGKRDGKDSSGRKKIVIMHSPAMYGILQSGTIVENRDAFFTIAKKYGVDVILAGHKHKNAYETKDNSRHITTASTAYEATWRNVSVLKNEGAWSVVVSSQNVLKTTVTARTGSPVDLSVHDDFGRIETPVESSCAIDENGSRQTSISVDYRPGLRFRVTGTSFAQSNSTYNIIISKNSEEDNTNLQVAGNKIPTGKGIVHEYGIDWDKVAASASNPVTIRIDGNADGMFERTISAGPVIDPANVRIPDGPTPDGGDNFMLLLLAGTVAAIVIISVVIVFVLKKRRPPEKDPKYK